MRLYHTVTSSLALLFLGVGLVPGPTSPSPPPPSLNLPLTITRVYDGDTVEGDIVIPVRVRMLDCWAPELKEDGGKEAREYLKGLAEGKKGLVSIPITGNDFGDQLSFGRILGTVYVGEKDMSAEMVRAGHATKNRVKH